MYVRDCLCVFCNPLRVERMGIAAQNYNICYYNYKICFLFAWNKDYIYLCAVLFKPINLINIMEQNFNKKVQISLVWPDGKVAFGREFSFEQFRKIDLSNFSECFLSWLPECKLSIEISNVESYS